MRGQVIECVANFSEGRQPSVIREIETAILGGAVSDRVAILHSTMDPDHHRSVITFAGAPDAVAAAAVRAVKRAAELIDLNVHHGVHPRLGAADVVPLVPVRGISLQDCAELAWQLGQEIWSAAGVPVYYYEAAAKRSSRARLEKVRRGQFEGLRLAAPSEPDRAPDVGGPELHPTAGAVIVGARKVLIAYNVNLDTTDLSVAKAIARTIRTSSGGFPHVKALGLTLETRGQVQVSMNLTDPEITPPHVVFRAICGEARRRGVEVAGSEIIGLIPRAALESAAADCLRIENYSPEVVLENRIDELLG